jgi:cytochrome oxidase assembly protein ShyY1
MYSLKFTMIIKHFSFYGRRYYLKLELVQSLIFFTLFVLCSLLAAWQWQRAEAFLEKEALEKHALKKQEVNTPSQSENGISQLSLSGHWVKTNFLLDNRTHKGKAGYYHLALFRPEASTQVLLVNLGWLPAPLIRSDIPTPSLPRDKQDITLTNIPLVKPIVWSSDHWPSPKEKNWPKRIQSIDIERFQLATKQNIESGYWQLAIGKGKLIDIYQSSPYLNKHKHLGYALQWLLIAIAALMVGFFSGIRDVETLDEENNDGKNNE